MHADAPISERRARRTDLCRRLLDAALAANERGDGALAALLAAAVAQLAADADPGDRAASAVRGYVAALAGASVPQA